MISMPQIFQTEAEAAAVIHLTVPRSEMRKVFGPAVGELMAALAEQGVKPASAVFAHHLKMSPDTFDFELGVKVAAPVKGTGRVKPGELPATKVARTIYSGPSSERATCLLSPASDIEPIELGAERGQKGSPVLFLRQWKSE
jgi:effector-binding domain-containing protein